jgi:hypothetical protein
MDNFNTLCWQYKRDILNFSEKICKGIGRPNFKMMTNLLYGMSESNSCHLSKIGRALKETISLKKTIDRLSRGVDNFNEGEKLLENYNNIVKSYVDDKSVFIIDGSDITKPCSVAMEGLDIVRDGSTGELAPGYMTLEIAVLTSRSRSPITVYDRLYSSREGNFVSQDDETLKGLGYISETFGNKGIRTLDRGYDALTYYEYFFKAQEKFIIRAKKNRDVKYKGDTINILKLANKFKGKYRIDFTGKDGKKIECKMTSIPITLVKYPNKKLNLIVVYGFGRTPLLLITNLNSDDKRLSTVVTKVYLMRWRIEEHFKFRKNQYKLEDFRVRSLNSIRTLHRITAILSGFVSMMSEKRDESLFVAQLIEASKRIYKPKKEKAKTKFMNYAIADGIFVVLNKSKVGILHFLFPPKPSNQLSFFPA